MDFPQALDQSIIQQTQLGGQTQPFVSTQSVLQQDLNQSSSGYQNPQKAQQLKSQQSHQQSSSSSGVTLTDQLIESLQPALVFKNFSKEINSLDISHDGKYLVAGSEDFSVSLYDLERGDKVNTYYSKRYGVDLVKFTHHNKCILVASKRDNNYRILYWSLHDNVILCSFIGHTDSIISIDLNPADSTFVSQAKDETTRVWEYERKQCKIRLNQSKASCFDNTGMILACLYRKGSSNANANSNQMEGGATTSVGKAGVLVQQVHLFNTENYEERPFSIFSMEDSDLQQAEIRTIKFSPDGQFILIGTTENLICLIDAFEGKMKHKLRGPIYNTASEVPQGLGNAVGNSAQQEKNNNSDANLTFEANFSPDSKYVICGSETPKQKVLCWNIETQTQVQLADFHPTTVLAVKFNHTYCMLVSACQNLVVWIPDPNHVSSSQVLTNSNTVQQNLGSAPRSGSSGQFNNTNNNSNSNKGGSVGISALHGGAPGGAHNQSSHSMGTGQQTNNNMMGQAMMGTAMNQHPYQQQQHHQHQGASSMDQNAQ